MNIVQMLNNWKLFRRMTLEPIVQDEDIEFPTWFWGDNWSGDFWNIDVKRTGLMDKMDMNIYAISEHYKQEYPIFFQFDRTMMRCSWLDEDRGLDIDSKNTYRTWLNRKENKEHGICEF